MSQDEVKEPKGATWARDGRRRHGEIKTKTVDQVRYWKAKTGTQKEKKKKERRAGREENNIDVEGRSGRKAKKWTPTG